MKHILICNIALLLVLTANAQEWRNAKMLVAPDMAKDDRFGYSVAISGDYAIIGSPAEDEDANGENTIPNAGSAYIFKKNSGNWQFIQKIVASDRSPGAAFGLSVTIENNYAVVGGSYIFKNNGEEWVQVQKINELTFEDVTAQVSISGDYMIIGSPGDYKNAAGVDSMKNAGAAYIFKNVEGTWQLAQKIVASDRYFDNSFGQSVSISGNYAFVGSLDSGGDMSFLSGSVYIFRNNQGVWEQVQKILASDRAAFDMFGWSVSVSEDYAIVGAYDEDEDATGENTLIKAGSAYIFKNDSGIWKQKQKIIASDRDFGDYFGFSVAISGKYAIVGAYSENEDSTGQNSLYSAGSAYIFKNNSGIWQEIKKITAPERALGDFFGISVAISGENIIVGAPQDDIVSESDSLPDAGSVHLLEISKPVSVNQPFDLHTSFSVFPNPANGKITIGLPNEEDRCELQITDINGKTVMYINNCTNNSKVDLSALRKGLYLVRVLTETNNYTKKLLLK